MSLKQERIVNQVLTNIARGYKNAGMIAQNLFPEAFVDKTGVTIPIFGKEAFKLYSTTRAPRAQSNVITPDTITSLDVVLKEHDAVFPIDWLENVDAFYDKEVRATSVVMDILLLGLEVEAATIAQNAANYSSSHKIALSGSSCLNNESKPVEFLKDCMEYVRKDIAKKPNTMCLGAEAYNTLAEHPALQEKIKYSMKGILTESLISEILGIKNVSVGSAITVSDNGTTSSDVWGDNIILAYVPEAEGSRSAEEPSYGYTLRHRQGALIVDEYDINPGKVVGVRCTDVRRPALIGAEAGYLITNVTE